ncbi:MAG: hypothetical protein IT221_16105 [Fluviicola sp.]|nr:hypothetical protein [Fluviicola sp.]
MKSILFTIFLSMFLSLIQAQETTADVLVSFDQQTRKLERKNKAQILSKKIVQGDLNNDRKDDVIIEVSWGAKKGNGVVFKTAYIYLSEDESYAKTITFSPSYCMEISQISDNQFYVNEFDNCLQQASIINQHIYILHLSEVLELVERK